MALLRIAPPFIPRNHRDIPMPSFLSFCMLCLILLIAAAPVPAQDAPPANGDPLRPAAIVAEEVPPVPQALVDRLEQYSNMRAASFSGWDPAGRGILIETRFANSAQVHRVYTPGGRREQITFLSEPVSGVFIPQTQQEEIVLSLSAGGNENYQLYYHHGKQYTTELLTDGTSRNRLESLRDDGSQMVVASNKRNGRDTDLYLADPRRAGSLDMLMEVDGEYWYVGDWSRDGSTLLLGRYVSINESYLAKFDVAARQRTDLPLPGEAPVGIGDAEFTSDGKSFYVAADADGEFRRLYRFDAESQQYQLITGDIDWDVSDIEIDRETGRVAFTVNEDGASRLYFLNDGMPQPVDLPLGIVSSLEFSPDHKHLGFTLSRADAPSDAYSLEIASGELTRWTYSEMGGLDPAGFVTAERIRFRSFDGREIPAYYFKPPNTTAEKPAPVLLYVHGGPESQYQPYFSSTIQFYVNELGLAVIAPNVRGSAGYGKTYLKLDNAELREDSVKDIGALLDWIDTREELDSERVAIMGGSYGGYMVLASLVHYGERIKAGVDIVGIANFISFLENTADYRRDLRRAEYGDERDPKMREVFERINPTSNAHKIRSALLVAHGVNDPRVPFSEAQQIAEKVREQQRSVWTVYAENEGHGFGKKDNADYLRAVQALFLSEHLGLE